MESKISVTEAVLKNELETLKEKYQRVVSSSASLSQELEYSRKQIFGIQQEYANLQRTAQMHIQNLSQQLQQSRQQLEMIQNLVKSLQFELQAAKLLEETSKRDLESMKVQLAKLQSDSRSHIEKYEASCLVIDKMVRENETTKAETSVLIQNMRGNLEAAEKEISLREDEIKDVSRQSESKINLIAAEKNEEIDRLKGRMLESDLEISRLQDVVESGNVSRREILDQSVILTQEVAYVRQQYAFLQQQAQSKVHQLQQELLQCQQLAQNMQQHCRQSMISREDEKKVADAKVVELRKETSMLRELLSERDGALAHATQKIATIEGLLSAREWEVAQQKKDIESRQLMHDRVVQEKQLLESFVLNDLPKLAVELEHLLAEEVEAEKLKQTQPVDQGEDGVAVALAAQPNMSAAVNPTLRKLVSFKSQFLALQAAYIKHDAKFAYLDQNSAWQIESAIVKHKEEYYREIHEIIKTLEIEKLDIQGEMREYRAHNQTLRKLLDDANIAYLDLKVAKSHRDAEIFGLNFRVDSAEAAMDHMAKVQRQLQWEQQNVRESRSPLSLTGRLLPQSLSALLWGKKPSTEVTGSPTATAHDKSSRSTASPSTANPPTVNSATVNYSVASPPGATPTTSALASPRRTAAATKLSPSLSKSPSAAGPPHVRDNADSNAHHLYSSPVVITAVNLSSSPLVESVGGITTGTAGVSTSATASEAGTTLARMGVGDSSTAGGTPSAGSSTVGADAINPS